MVPFTEQPFATQVPPPDGEVSKGAVVDEGTQLPTKAKPSEDALTIRDTSRRPRKQTSSFRLIQRTLHLRRLKFRDSFRNSPCVFVLLFFVMALCHKL